MGFSCSLYRRVAVLLAVASAAFAFCAPRAHADLAPDSRVIYVSNDSGNYDIYSIRVDGTDRRQLTTSPADDFDPAASPDGKRIAFVRNDGGNRDIWVMRSDGSGEVRLTTDPASDRYPAWSADGTQLAFRSNRHPSTSFDIWRMQADGTKPVRVTADAARWGQSIETTPSWSPDGSKLAFVSDRDGNQEIYESAVDGSSPRRFTNNNAADYTPSWSPDGSRIVFVSDRAGNNEVFVMRSGDGGGETNLTQNLASDRYPAWSPDGSKIVFRSSRFGSFDLFLMSADGSDVVHLMKAQGHQIEPGFQGFGLIGGVPAAAPDEPAATGPQADPVQLPAIRRCVDRRKFSFHLHHARSSRIVDARAYVNGAQVEHIRGRAIERLMLARLPQKRFRLKIVTTQNTGAQLISVRTYRRCTKTRPHTRRGRGHTKR